jgi:hypothetical protein
MLFSTILEILNLKLYVCIVHGEKNCVKCKFNQYLYFRGYPDFGYC